MKLSLRAWLLLSYLVVFSLPWIAIVGSGALAGDLRAQTREQLTAQGQLWALRIERAMADRSLGLRAAVDELAGDLALARDRTLCATQIVDADAVVLASSGGTTDQSLAQDPEVERALTGQVGAWERERNKVRPSRDKDLSGPSRFASVRLFVAVPIVYERQVVGAIVTSRTPREELQAFVQMGPPLALALALAVALTLVLAIAAGYFGSRSLHSLAGVARRVAAGERDSSGLAPLERSHVREVAALADAVTAMHRQLQARLDYIDEFAGNVAHEFRTPIATLRGTFELMHDDPEMDPEQRDRFVANAQAELQRLEALVDGLLALARAERSVPHERIDLGALVRDVAARRGLAVQGSARVVMGAAGQLASVVENLLENATQHGGPHVSVELFDDGFAVKDDGPGIAPADLERMFDRFFTTDRKRGTGLGLALVRLLVQAHGGTVTAESRPGHTELRVRLPAAP
ncbi:MAG TPA: ATP-binding protein [Nannocystaceae bacterium]|nr:ATP-binding protein [Nannocystaceae bacterium]